MQSIRGCASFNSPRRLDRARAPDHPRDFRRTAIAAGRASGKVDVSAPLPHRVNEAASPPPAVVVAGCSAGGLRALQIVLSGLAPDFAAPLIAVCHTGSEDVSLLCELLSRSSTLPVHEATERTFPIAGHVYIAPSGYHLLLDDDGRFVLSVDPRVGFARPSIDVLFDSAAAACGPRAIGVVMTGANSDGAAGLKHLRARGGLAVVQDPADAEVDLMPVAALDQAGADHCLPLAKIPPLLNGLVAARTRPDRRNQTS